MWCWDPWWQQDPAQFCMRAHASRVDQPRFCPRYAGTRGAGDWGWGDYVGVVGDAWEGWVLHPLPCMAHSPHCSSRSSNGPWGHWQSPNHCCLYSMASHWPSALMHALSQNWATSAVTQAPVTIRRGCTPFALLWVLPARSWPGQKAHGKHAGRTQPSSKVQHCGVQAVWFGALLVAPMTTATDAAVGQIVQWGGRQVGEPPFPSSPPTSTHTIPPSQQSHHPYNPPTCHKTHTAQAPYTTETSSPENIHPNPLPQNLHPFPHKPHIPPKISHPVCPATKWVVTGPAAGSHSYRDNYHIAALPHDNISAETCGPRLGGGEEEAVLLVPGTSWVCDELGVGVWWQQGFV